MAPSLLLVLSGDVGDLMESFCPGLCLMVMEAYVPSLPGLFRQVQSKALEACEAVEEGLGQPSMRCLRLQAERTMRFLSLHPLKRRDEPQGNDMELLLRLLDISCLV